MRVSFLNCCQGALATLFAACFIVVASTSAVEEMATCSGAEGGDCPQVQSPKAASLLQMRFGPPEAADIGGQMPIDGAAAPLSEEGYRAVAALHNPYDMELFVWRTARSMGLRPVDKDAVQRRLVRPTYESFAALKAEIYDGTKGGPAPFVSATDKSRPPPSVDGTDLSLAMQPNMRLMGLQATAKVAREPRISSKKDEKKRISHAQIRSRVQPARAKYGRAIVGKIAGEDTSLGALATLDEGGYTSVVNLKSNSEMEKFMRRTFASLRINIVNEDAFKAAVPWFSGEAGSSSFGEMKGKVLNLLGTPNAWVSDPAQPATIVSSPPQLVSSPAQPMVSSPAQPESLANSAADLVQQEAPGSLAQAAAAGRDVPVTEEGYKAIAALDDNTEMGYFIEKVVKDQGLVVVNYGGIQGLAPFYSGDRMVQNLASLKAEIGKASQTPGSWVQPPGNVATALLQLSDQRSNGQSKAGDTEETAPSKEGGSKGKGKNGGCAGSS